ncbi:protein of unknown function (plasmid) [Ralstonia solanacearum PSI07]|nr:protein of unknown function [Ralstonia solanacearum PSI07]
MARRQKVSTLHRAADGRSDSLANTLKDRLPSPTKLVNCTQFGCSGSTKPTVMEYTISLAAPGSVQRKLVLLDV